MTSPFRVKYSNPHLALFVPYLRTATRVLRPFVPLHTRNNILSSSHCASIAIQHHLDRHASSLVNACRKVEHRASRQVASSEQTKFPVVRTFSSTTITRPTDPRRLLHTTPPSSQCLLTHPPGSRSTMTSTPMAVVAPDLTSAPALQASHVPDIHPQHSDEEGNGLNPNGESSKKSSSSKTKRIASSDEEDEKPLAKKPRASAGAVRRRVVESDDDAHEPVSVLHRPPRPSRSIEPQVFGACTM